MYLLRFLTGGDKPFGEEIITLIQYGYDLKGISGKKEVLLTCKINPKKTLPLINN